MEKDTAKTRTFSMYQHELNLIEAVKDKRFLGNRSLALHQILREWKELVWDKEIKLINPPKE